MSIVKSRTLKLRPPRKRLAGIERREQIMNAAQGVFSEFGLEGAKTQQIAKAADVSEALVFRHFPSKKALYKAVLRRVIDKQDSRFERLATMPASTENLINSIREFMETCVLGGGSPDAHGARLLLASLARDGSYASLVYRRASKLWTKSFAKSLAAAHQCGDALVSEIKLENGYAFVEHVGTMMLAVQLNRKADTLYEGDKDELVRDAVWFACRGIGVTDAALGSYFSAQSPKR